MKKIIVTGATGLIGKQIIERLVKQRHEVIAFVRNPNQAKLPKQVRLVHWESGMNLAGEWVTAIDGADAIIHLAGSPVAEKWTPEHKLEIEKSRVIGTRMIVEAMKLAKKKPECLISSSAVGFYGTDPAKTFDEDSPSGSDFLANVCSLWESEALKAKEMNVRVALIRTGVVLDAKGGALPKQLLPFKMFVGGAILPGTQAYPWIHIEDEIQIILWALENESVVGAINAVAPEMLDNKTFSKTLAKILSRPCLFPVPALPMKLMFGEGAIIVLEGQKVIPKRTQELGYNFKFPTLDKALSDILKI